MVYDIEYPVRERESNEWLLRNLTTREVVSVETRTAQGGTASLEAILKRQICWEGTVPQHEEDRFLDVGEEGNWAGHRFDVVAKGMFEEQGRKWKDISDHTKMAV